MSKPVAIAIRADHPEVGSRGPFAGYSNIHISVPSGGYGMHAPVAMPDPEARAVIDLLAAAPDMLEAIEGLLAAHESTDPRADRAGWAMQARRAIYKAKGGKL